MAKPLIRRLPGDTDLDFCLARLRRGSGDPTHRFAGGQWWRTTRTPDGPATLALRREGSEIVVRAWGAGAAYAADSAAELLGLHDRRTGFCPAHPLLIELDRRNPVLRVGRTSAVLEAYAPSVLEQKVTGREAFGAFRRLTRSYGELAPGPTGIRDSPAYGMYLQPDAAGWAAIPSWAWLRAMVDGRRSTTLIRGARRAAALERTLRVPDADAALRSLPGVGAWTSAQIRAVAHGDPDAWSVGDYHVPRQIGLALTGRELPDDDAVAEVLEPWRGHRLRVQMLIMKSGIAPARRGPRRTLPTHLPN